MQHKSNRYKLFLVLVGIAWISPPGSSQEEMTDPNLIPDLFRRTEARLSETRPAPPTTQAEWESYREPLRKLHADALGVSLHQRAAPVEFQILESLDREGYTLKKILFECRPQVPIPAHLYLPDNLAERAPAILCVHGHWPGAKNAPQVHARCVFLAKRGFVVLALDAIGAGERAFQGIAYHGRQLGYQPLPAGITLAGLQVEDNRRAIDLLASLPEVDPEKIGVTGASGGGNQSFNLAILDPRVQATAAVCFFGSYTGYLRGAHCACELAPGALVRADEGMMAGLVAPRSLLIIAAQEDQGAAFRIEDARRNAAVAEGIFRAAGHLDRFQFVEFAGGHDYSQAMRETVVAFFEKALMGKDSGASVAEPELDLLTPDELQVLGSEGLPKGSLFVPQIAGQRAAELITEFDAAGKSWADPGQRKELGSGLIEEVLGGFPTHWEVRAVGEPRVESGTFENLRRTLLETEEGVRIELTESFPANQTEAAVSKSLAQSKGGTILVLGELPKGAGGVVDFPCRLLALAPRGTGPTDWPEANQVDCEDYLLAQGSAILGRPMLGQWVWDAFQAAHYLRSRDPDRRVAYFGQGALGLAAILAGVLDEKRAGVGAADFLASYRWPDRYDDRWGLVHFVPGILRFGDIPQIGAGIFPAPWVAASPRAGSGKVLDEADSRGWKETLLANRGAETWESLAVLPNLAPAEALVALAVSLNED